MAANIIKTVDYGYYDQIYKGKYEDYPWLPCVCNAGWDDMAIHDQRYHSAKGFLTARPPGHCSVQELSSKIVKMDEIKIAFLF